MVFNYKLLPNSQVSGYAPSGRVLRSGNIAVKTPSPDPVVDSFHEHLHGYGFGTQNNSVGLVQNVGKQNAASKWHSWKTERLLIPKA